MAGTFPSDPGFQAVDFTSREYQVVDESMVGRLFVQHLGGHRWEFTVRHESLSAAAWAPVNAFLESQNGSMGNLPDRASRHQRCRWGRGWRAGELLLPPCQVPT